MVQRPEDGFLCPKHAEVFATCKEYKEVDYVYLDGNLHLVLSFLLRSLLLLSQDFSTKKDLHDSE
jgi:hypothetical protein